MTVKIDDELCIGCGVCCSMMEDVFELDDDEGVAIVKDNISPDGEDLIETIDACPVGAISK
jgi:ferredoxin